MSMPVHLKGSVAIVLIAVSCLLGTTDAGAFGILRHSSRDFSDRDIELMEQAAKPLYEDSIRQIGDRESWSNEDSGNSGTVTLQQQGKKDGLFCKGVRHEVHVGKRGRDVELDVVRCLHEDGTWKLH